MFCNVDQKLVTYELSEVLCEDKSQRSSKIVGNSSCCGVQEMAGHSNTESRMSEDTTLIHHQEVSLIGTENGYTASQQHEH